MRGALRTQMKAERQETEKNLQEAANKRAAFRTARAKEDVLRKHSDAMAVVSPRMKKRQKREVRTESETPEREETLRKGAAAAEDAHDEMLAAEKRRTQAEKVDQMAQARRLGEGQKEEPATTQPAGGGVRFKGRSGAAMSAVPLA